jgi:hypothetical protein
MCSMLHQPASRKAGDRCEAGADGYSPDGRRSASIAPGVDRDDARVIAVVLFKALL